MSLKKLNRLFWSIAIPTMVFMGCDIQNQPDVEKRIDLEANAIRFDDIDTSYPILSYVATEPGGCSDGRNYVVEMAIEYGDVFETQADAKVSTRFNGLSGSGNTIGVESGVIDARDTFDGNGLGVFDLTGDRVTRTVVNIEDDFIYNGQTQDNVKAFDRNRDGDFVRILYSDDACVSRKAMKSNGTETDFYQAKLENLAQKAKEIQVTRNSKLDL